MIRAEILSVIEQGFLWQLGLAGIPLVIALCIAQEQALRKRMMGMADVWCTAGYLAGGACVILLLVGGLIALMMIP